MSARDDLEHWLTRGVCLDQDRRRQLIDAFAHELAEKIRERDELLNGPCQSNDQHAPNGNDDPVCVPPQGTAIPTIGEVEEDWARVKEQIMKNVCESLEREDEKLSDLAVRQKWVGRQFQNPASHYGDPFVVLDVDPKEREFWVHHNNGTKAAHSRHWMNACTEVLEVPEKRSTWVHKGDHTAVTVRIADEEDVVFSYANNIPICWPLPDFHQTFRVFHEERY